MKEKKIIPQYMLLPVLVTLCCNFLAYNGTRLFTSGKFHFDFTTSLDNLIPVVPQSIVIYIGCYLFWVANYILGCRQVRHEAYRFMSADIFAKIICLIIFMVLPTTNIRPIIANDSFWNIGLNMIYRFDPADNLFPSIHCLTSWLCYIAVRKNNSVPKAYKVVSLIIAMSICVSTLTTKQHVLIDVVGGVGLAEISYWFVDASGFSLFYRRLLEGRFYVQKNKNR